MQQRKEYHDDGRPEPDLEITQIPPPIMASAFLPSTYIVHVRLFMLVSVSGCPTPNSSSFTRVRSVPYIRIFIGRALVEIP